MNLKLMKPGPVQNHFSRIASIGKATLFLLLITLYGCNDNSPRILVFSKTKGYYHESIPAGVAALQKLGAANGFEVDTTKDASFFQDDKLKRYKAVVFLSTTGNVLNADQQAAFERFIQAGGGFVGIHAAADTEYEWPWYNKLVGAYFMSHPKVQEATVRITDTTHLSTRGLPLEWKRTDEWYNYRSIYDPIHVVANLDEESYDGGALGDHHPIAWYHEFDGGRAFYTGGGHTNESYEEPLFVQHLTGAIRYAMGENITLDYGKAYAVKTPEENRFTKSILSNDLNEPMELAVAPDGRVFFCERAGKFYVYDPSTKTTKHLYDFPVLPDTKEGFGNGLLGLTLDPDFATNNYIYFFYTPNKSPARQNVSRFTMKQDGTLDFPSEKVILEIPLELEVSAHTGGSLAWDKDKNLFISTGDNTVPFQSGGFAPIDEIPGRITFDAQRSAGNTNDLRGKILRIHPEADGSYTIPEGNLFPKGTAQTRPEIYTMGCRNPYRISVDAETSILYWGEIGPDSGVDGPQGPRGYDEFNQAKKPGNYGWPYFVGDNKPYHEYDFAKKEVGPLFDPAAPVNTSPNNSGLQKLLPAQKAMIWYPYDRSIEFPEIGSSGRSAMAGPVYHFNPELSSDVKLPEYYDDALFVFDWMRNWLFVVRFDENHNFKRLEPFMAVSGDFKRPIDMEIGPDGAIYLLEYGSVYGIDNVDARLVRIDYNGGNRSPIAGISAKTTMGAAPLEVTFKNTSYDFDEDELTYSWNFEGTPDASTEANPAHTFTKNGLYNVTLKTTDPSGASALDTLQIIVGNTLPEVKITTTGNQTFFFEGTPWPYAVEVSDKEDASVDPENLSVTLKYIPKVAREQNVAGHQTITSSYNLGKTLMEGSDCKACHQLDQKSVGPAFMDVAKRYQNDKDATTRLAGKVIAGGGGVWGEHAMNAHPQLSKEDATEIVKYVLSLAAAKSDQRLPAQGNLSLKEHHAKDIFGRYVLSASYTDKGSSVVPLTNRDTWVLRPATVQAEEADVLRNIDRNPTELGSIHHKSLFVLKNIDLTGIRNITYRYSSVNIAATIEVHIDSPKGTLISTLNYTPTGSWENYKEAKAAIQDPGGKHDLYFVFKKETPPNEHMCSLDWVRFEK
jgi:cytochrome c